MTTVIIRPNGAGTYTEIIYATGTHWQQVDEAVASDTDYVASNPLTYKPGDADENGTVAAADVTYINRVILGLDPETNECDADQDGDVDSGDVTVVNAIIATTYDFGTSSKIDSYALETPSIPTGSTINSVKVYHKGKSGPSAGGRIIPGLRLAGTNLDGDDSNLTTSWVNRNNTVGRPGGGTWAIADFADIEVRITLERGYSANVAFSQVYVEIDYTEPPEAQIFFMI